MARGARLARRGAVLLCLGASASVAAAVQPPPNARIGISVAFQSDGSCVVSINDGRALRTTASGGGGVPGTDLECQVPSVTARSGVDLTVMLPGDFSPLQSDFPRLSWALRDSHWVGTAALPAAPAFVRVPQPNGRRPRVSLAAMPWNFYAWFVCAALFSGAYFVWAWRSTSR